MLSKEDRQNKKLLKLILKELGFKDKLEFQSSINRDFPVGTKVIKSTWEDKILYIAEQLGINIGGWTPYAYTEDSTFISCKNGLKATNLIYERLF